MDTVAQKLKTLDLETLNPEASKDRAHIEEGVSTTSGIRGPNDEFEIAVCGYRPCGDGKYLESVWHIIKVQDPDPDPERPYSSGNVTINKEALYPAVRMMYKTKQHVAVGSHLYSLGGLYPVGSESNSDSDGDIAHSFESKRYRKVWRLDVNRPSAGWKAVPPMTFPNRYDPPSVALQGKLYVLGGFFKSQFPEEAAVKELGWMEAYDPISNTWEPLPNPPSGFFLDADPLIFTALESKNQILVARYNHDVICDSATFCIYDVITRSWTTLKPDPRALFARYPDQTERRCIAVGNTLYWGLLEDEDIIVQAYELDMDRWIHGRINIRDSVAEDEFAEDEFPANNIFPASPPLLHLNNQRFCLFFLTSCYDRNTCQVSNLYLNCLILDISPINDEGKPHEQHDYYDHACYRVIDEKDNYHVHVHDHFWRLNISIVSIQKFPLDNPIQFWDTVLLKQTWFLETGFSKTEGAALGEAFNILHEGLKKYESASFNFSSAFERFKHYLDKFAPAMEKIRKAEEELGLPTEETKSLIDQIKKGKKLISKFSTNYRFLPFEGLKYHKELAKLNNAIVMLQTRRDVLRLLLEANQKEKETRPSYSVPKPPDFIVGFNVPLKELKTKLWEESLLLLTAPGGCGKTTLVKMLCQDGDIKEKFGDNIFFATISNAPNLKVIVQTLLNHAGAQVPEFQSDEDAVNHLQELPKRIGLNPTLLILDDVWPGSEALLEKFKFHMPNFKILVTTRTAFTRFSSYELKPLDAEDAMTLFHHSTLQDGSSCIPDDILDKYIDKILKGCGGFPLALEVIGGSFRGQSADDQLSRLRKWSIDDIISNIDLHKCLQRSLEFSGPEVKFKKFFMDLGSFPEDRRTYVAALIDMWAELYNLGDDGIDAIAALRELNIRHLASLVMTKKDASEFMRYYNEDFVTQHDLLRELAISESKKQPIEEMQRLIMDIRENALPLWYTEQNQQPNNARLISISTDELFTSSWCNIQAPNVEVLVLNFQSKIYSLPEFVEKMNKLKAVIITNYGFFHAELINFQLLKSLSNLKRIRLEKVSIPSLFKAPIWLRSLKKLSLFMCSFGQAFGNSTMKVKDALPNLMEINIDYCNDLVELPAWLCDVILLEKLSITNCHHLSALPKGIEMLENLEVLRLRSCTTLSEFPDSIYSLQKLRVLDISDCLGIRKFPDIFRFCNKLRALHGRDTS